MIEVRDEQQCEAPEGGGMLRQVAASWFLHEGNSVAVIDTTRLFSGWLTTTMRVATTTA